MDARSRETVERGRDGEKDGERVVAWWDRETAEVERQGREKDEGGRGGEAVRQRQES